MTERKDRLINGVCHSLNEGETAFRLVLETLGFKPEADEGLEKTPLRMSKAYRQLLEGYGKNAEDVLGTTFPGEGYDEVVVLKHIPFASLCEHHLLPFTGHASIAYLPGSRVVGLSKLARLVDMHARRLQIQECMTKDIADDIKRVLAPRGVAVLVEATHTCMTIRGVQKPGASMVTSSLAGSFKDDPSARAEVLQLLRG